MNYRVTDTRQIVRMTQAGTEQMVYRVWLVTDRGATGHVDVPAAQWNTDDLQSILMSAAADLDLAFQVAEGS